MQGEYPVGKILRQLERDHLLPAILFRTARKQCDNDIERLSRTKGLWLPAMQQEAIIAEIDRLIRDYNVEADVVLNHDQYPTLVTTGVGAHHAGQLLIWRLFLEELMSRGLLRLMIATGTVAAGVDFPARSVVITSHSKRGAEGFNTLSSAEFQQMSGRAGRRGKDVVGFCLVAPGPFSDARVINEVAKRPPEPLRSAYFASPSTVLNLLKYRSVDDLRYTVQRSLAAFLDRKSANLINADAKREEEKWSSTPGESENKRRGLKRSRRRAREAEEVSNRQITQLEQTLAGLQALGFLENGKLTEKGLWSAQLCTSLVLELSEAISTFLFNGDEPLEELVGLVAGIAGDAHRMYLTIKQNPIKSEAFDKLAGILAQVRKAYVNPQTAETEVVPAAATTVLAWLEASDWGSYASLLRLGGVSDGDAARLIMQTADHLGQISRLFETHPELARLAAEGRRKLLKPPLSESLLVE